MLEPSAINILTISGRLLDAAECNAVRLSCGNKTKKQYIHNVHYTDNFQLNVLLTHNTFMTLMISCKHPPSDVVKMIQLLYSYVMYI